jgi:hypothetical protein
MNKMYLVLGDWSDDGHGKTDKVLLEGFEVISKNKTLRAEGPQSEGSLDTKTNGAG